MGDLFKREREFCMLFMKNRQNENVSIEYSISNKSVDVLVLYKDKKYWDAENMRVDINRLWRNFNLAYIGYKTECLTLSYTNQNGFYVSEYSFPMQFFDIDNFHSAEF